MENKIFKVDLQGLLDVLSHHLYSGEQVFIRELLQNSCDAISARLLHDDEFVPRVDVELQQNTLMIQDNGIGLTPNEVQQFLSSIGSSSKRDDISKSRQSFIGQFGIGLLSCFMVSENITVITKSDNYIKAIKWVGKIDGTYSIEELDGDFKIGTRVYLSAKSDKQDFFTRETVHSLIQYFGRLLPYEIYLANDTGEEMLSGVVMPWQQDHTSEQEKHSAILQFGREEFAMVFENYIEIKSANGETSGVAYVLPYKVHQTSVSSHKCYMKNMLISDRVENILPHWAFFVKAVINTSELRPTASRESLYNDEKLLQVQQQLGESIKQYMVDLSQRNREMLDQIISLHSIPLKALAVADVEFYEIIMPLLKFPSSIGNVTIAEILAQADHIRHVPDVDMFRQMAPIAVAQDTPMLNTGYIYDQDLIEQLPDVFSEFIVEQVDVSVFADMFDDLSLDENEATVDFMQQADRVLLKYQCQVAVKKFVPENLSALYYMSASVAFQREIQRSRSVASDSWKDILGTVHAGEEPEYASLFLNYNNPLVKKIVKITDPLLLDTALKILYVNSMLMGHHPLNNAEMNILNNKLLNLLDLVLIDNK